MKEEVWWSNDLPPRVRSALLQIVSAPNAGLEREQEDDDQRGSAPADGFLVHTTGPEMRCTRWYPAPSSIVATPPDPLDAPALGPTRILFEKEACDEVYVWNAAFERHEAPRAERGRPTCTSRGTLSPWIAQEWREKGLEEARALTIDARFGDVLQRADSQRARRSGGPYFSDSLLPLDIWQLIFEHLSADDLLALSQVNRTMHELILQSPETAPRSWRTARLASPVSLQPLVRFAESIVHLEVALTEDMAESSENWITACSRALQAATFPNLRHFALSDKCRPPRLCVFRKPAISQGDGAAGPRESILVRLVRGAREIESLSVSVEYGDPALPWEQVAEAFDALARLGTPKLQSLCWRQDVVDHWTKNPRLRSAFARFLQQCHNLRGLTVFLLDGYVLKALSPLLGGVRTLHATIVSAHNPALRAMLRAAPRLRAATLPLSLGDFSSSIAGATLPLASLHLCSRIFRDADLRYVRGSHEEESPGAEKEEEEVGEEDKEEEAAAAEEEEEGGDEPEDEMSETAVTVVESVVRLFGATLTTLVIESDFLPALDESEELDEEGEELDEEGEELDSFPSILHLTLRMAAVDGQSVARFRSLSSLVLDSVFLKDEDLEAILTRCRNLESLSLRLEGRELVGVADVIAEHGAHLRALSITGLECEIDDSRDLVSLARGKCCNITRLSLNNPVGSTSVYCEGIEEILSNWRALSSVSISELVLPLRTLVRLHCSIPKVRYTAPRMRSIKSSLNVM